VLAVLYYGMPRLELTAKPDVDLDIVVVSLRSTEYHSGSGCAEREFLVPEKGGFDAVALFPRQVTSIRSSHWCAVWQDQHDWTDLGVPD
jgi:hypothetical protein